MKRLTSDESGEASPFAESIFSDIDLVHLILSARLQLLNCFDDYCPLLLVNKKFHRVTGDIIRRNYAENMAASNRILRFFNPTTLDLRSRTLISPSGMTHITNLQCLAIGSYAPGLIDLVSTLTTLTAFTTSYNASLRDEHLMPLTSLTSLSIHNCRYVTDRALITLSRLTELAIRQISEGITDRSVSQLTNLTSLQLMSNRSITDKGLGPLTALTRLNLSHDDRITDACLKRLPNLTDLNLDTNKRITSLGIAHLSSKLMRLSLVANVNITDACLSQFTALVELDIFRNPLITLDTASRLTALTKLAAVESALILRGYNTMEQAEWLSQVMNIDG